MRKTLRKHYEKKKGKSLACASKENLNFDNQSIQVVFLFSSWCFLKEIENMLTLFLSTERNTRESLGELEKAMETLACGSCSTAFLVLPNFHSCFYLTIRLFALDFYRAIV